MSLNLIIISYILLIIVYMLGPSFFKIKKINKLKFDIFFSIITVLVILLYLIYSKFPPKFGPIGL